MVIDRELFNGVDGDEPGPEVKRFNPNSFGFSRGRRLEELAKRLNPASFSFSRGKRSSYPVAGDITELYSKPLAMDEKRAPPSGFTGMRGKRADAILDRFPELGELTALKRHPPEGYVAVRGKRVPSSGLMGQRAEKRAPPSGFQGLRGRKRASSSNVFQDWSGSPWTKRVPPSGFQILRGKKASYATKRSPPEGFMGLRGKRSIMEEVLNTLRVRTNGYKPLVKEGSLRDFVDAMTNFDRTEATSGE
ncbi:hypothetical protein LSH36_353g02007 [Paralvinella palmiformis]|uniref:Uncharacterized protein n=1 Tax=Paralvinella palmiformis TaxID=53620 RepID=A0AAD9JF10_9ANNE|nr:hypothetical protein LSH36_353g02007 [Paralvinella palmiformis]